MPRGLPGAGRVKWFAAFVVAVLLTVAVSCDKTMVGVDADVPPRTPCDTNCPPPRVDTVRVVRDSLIFCFQRDYDGKRFECTDGIDREGP